MNVRSMRRGVDGSAAEETPALAQRFAWPGVKDARWIVGVLLLLLGIVGTLRTVAAFDDSVEVWKVKRALNPGDRLAASDVVRTKVRLADGDRAYLRAAEKAVGGVVQRPLAAGELVPRAAVGAPSSVNVRSVSVSVDKGQADIVRAGSHVEVWVAEKTSDTGTASYAKPKMMVENALVSRVGSRNGGVVTVADGQPVEVLVPRDTLPDVIDAVNSGARITLVPTVSGAAS